MAPGGDPQLLGARRARHGVAVSRGSRGYGNRSAPPAWVFGVRLEVAFLVVSFTTLKLVAGAAASDGHLHSRRLPSAQCRSGPTEWRVVPIRPVLG